MNIHKHDQIIEDFVSSNHSEKCDLRRVSHLIISQAIREAEYHTYRNEGEKRERYVQTRLFLEDALDYIEESFYDGTTFSLKHFVALKEAFEVSGLLIKTRHQEERQLFDVLIRDQQQIYWRQSQ